MKGSAAIVLVVVCLSVATTIHAQMSPDFLPFLLMANPQSSGSSPGGFNLPLLLMTASGSDYMRNLAATMMFSKMLSGGGQGGAA